MKAVLMSIQARHNRNIESGKKTSELRTRPPKLQTPFKVYTYESGFDGRHMVVNEWICRDITTWRICMGIPAHLPISACIEPWEIKKYSGKDCKNISEMKISNLKIYDKPKELYNYLNHKKHQKCLKLDCFGAGCWKCENNAIIVFPPQSWCYVEE